MEFITLPSAKALGLPLSSAVRAGEFLYLSGAIGNKPGTMTLVEGGLSAQARQAMENLGEVLRACGIGFADTVKFTIMLADMRRWAEFNAVYLEYFDPARLPARSAFGASGLALGGEVEVECVGPTGRASGDKARCAETLTSGFDRSTASLQVLIAPRLRFQRTKGGIS